MVRREWAMANGWELSGALVFKKVTGSQLRASTLVMG